MSPPTLENLAVPALAMLLTASIITCGGDTEVAPGDQPSGNAEDVAQDYPALLAEGEFIDTKPIGGSGSAWISIPGGLPGVVSRADAVVVAEITEIVDVTIPTRPAPPNWPVAEIEGRPFTTYSARVVQWLKAAGRNSILITGFGGITASGPNFLDGDFLLEPGRRYVLALKEKRAELPGPGQYERSGLGFGSFEVTDGSVHVLNNPLTQELQGRFGGMPLQEFVETLRDYVANPPPSPTPLPSPQREDLTPRNSFVIDTVAIDTDIKGAAANTATSLGTLQTCNTLAVGERRTIDITADAVAPLGESEGGITAFQFVLVYDPTKVTVAASKQDMLLAGNPGFSAVSFSDGTPDVDGSFLVAVADFGESTTPESGSGVLARITLEGVGRGVTALSLTNVKVLDNSNLAYTINKVPDAEVAVDVSCP